MVDFSAAVYCRTLKLQVMVYQYLTVISLVWYLAVLSITPKNEPFVPDFNFLQTFVFFFFVFLLIFHIKMPVTVNIPDFSYHPKNTKYWHTQRGLSRSFLIIQGGSERVKHMRTAWPLKIYLVDEFAVRYESQNNRWRYEGIKMKFSVYSLC